MYSPQSPHAKLLVAAALVTSALGLAAASGAPVQAAPGDFTVAPTALSFPATYIGATSEIGVTVTNVSGSPQSPAFAGGAPADSTNFGSVQNCAGTTLAPGGSCTFTYRFQPKAEGSFSSNTAIGIDGENFTITMSGTGLFPLNVAPTTLSFPDTDVGSTSTLQVVITNVSPVPQSPTFAGGAPADSTNFGSVQNCAGTTLSPGGTCAFTYTFKPTVEGSFSTNTAIGVDGKNFAISMSGSTDSSATTTTTATPTTTTTTPTTPTTTEPGATAPTVTPATLEPPTASPAATPLPTGAAPGLVSLVPGPIVSGDAQVVAQGIVAFPDGSFQWAHEQLDPSGWPQQLDGSAPVFFAADGPDAVLVSVQGQPLALLDAGEATFVEPGSAGVVTPPVDGAFATARRITFVSGSGPDSFGPGEGRRDVNLVGAILAPGDTLELASPFPLLIVVTGGELVDADGTVFDAPSGAVTAGPAIALRNDGNEPATVLAAAIGSQLG